jgi:hypothetical protein
MPTFEEMKALLTNALDNPSGCWADYNRLYRVQQSLQFWSNMGKSFSFMEQDEVPEIPDTDDYSDLEC